MSIEGQGHFFTIYFPGFVCFVLYKAKISGEDYVVPNVLSPRNLVFRPDIMEETVKSSDIR